MVTAVLGAVSTASTFIKTSAAGPNADAAKQTLPSALGGNLAAVQAFVNRSTIQTVSSAQPWQDGLAQIRSAHPDYPDLARDAAAAGHFPASWWQLQPAAVYPATQAQAWSVSQQKAEAAKNTPAGATPKGSDETNGEALMTAAKGAAVAKWFVFGVVAVAVAGAVYYFRKVR
jgi:hypothetical protein